MCGGVYCAVLFSGVRSVVQCCSVGCAAQCSAEGSAVQSAGQCRAQCGNSAVEVKCKAQRCSSAAV